MKKENKSRICVTIAFKDRDLIASLVVCVKSFLNQTQPPFEIIVVGKEEDLYDFKNFFTKDEFKSVKLTYSDADKNDARNIGIKAAKTDFVVFADYDMKAATNLLEKCVEATYLYDVLFIPEKGSDGNFWEECRKLQKELVKYDMDTITPRFFRKNIFSDEEKPFNKEFGGLDEWGFNLGLQNKKVKVGIVDSYVIIKEHDLTLTSEIKNKFVRGFGFPNFFKKDSKEAWRRVDPVKRGLLFYTHNIKYFFHGPFIFVGLLFFKAVSLISFFAGAFVSLLITRKSYNVKQNIHDYYNSVADTYIANMYSGTNWARYVDKKEKEFVKEVWKLDKKKKIGNEKILDLGTGPGRWSKFFLDLGFSKIIGLDISEKMISKAKKEIKSQRFAAQVGDLEKLPFKTESFDKVFCFRTFKYLPNPQKALLEMTRVVKKNGTVLVEITNNNIQNRIAKLFSHIINVTKKNSSLASSWEYFGKANFYSAKEIRNLILKCNGKIIKTVPLFILPSAKVPPMIDKIFFKILVIIDKFFMKVFPKELFVRSWLIIFSKDK